MKQKHLWGSSHFRIASYQCQQGGSFSWTGQKQSTQQHGKAHSSKSLSLNPSRKQEDPECTEYVAAITYLMHNTDSQSSRMAEVYNLIARNTCKALPKWTFGPSSSAWTKRQKKGNPVPRGVATSSENSELHENTPLKLHALQYRMYHWVHRKKEGSLETLPCSKAQKVENFHKDKQALILCYRWLSAAVK